MNIPKGKEVKIAVNGKGIFEGLSNSPKMTLYSDLTLTLRSQFSPLLGDQSSSARTLLGVVGQLSRDVLGFGFSGQFKEQGYQVWTSTDPIRFSIEVMFHMKTSAKNDVFYPSQALMKLPLPYTSEKGIGLTAPGPSIAEAMGTTTQYGTRYSFRCGVFYLPNVIVEAVEPTMSSETDSEGYPIWCQLKIDISSIFTATQNEINLFGYGESKGYGTSSQGGTNY